MEQLPPDVKVVVLEIHAEATSEKIAMGWHFDGKVSLVLGTHTHVATADDCILPKGTGYITDVGMTGPYNSVLGRRTDRVLKAMMYNLHVPFEHLANGVCQLVRLCIQSLALGQPDPIQGLEQ